MAGADLRLVRLDLPQPRLRHMMSRVDHRVHALRARIGTAPSRPTQLDLALRDERSGLMWFPTPRFLDTSAPYLYTVWDLQHRLQPFFPEVSVTGLTFEQREAHYGRVCRRAAFNLVPNEAARAELCRFYGVDADRVRAVHQPTSDFALHPPEPAADPVPDVTDPILFYPAQFWPHKNHVVVLEALRLLQRDHGRRFTAVFTGSDKGNRAYVEAYAQRLGVSDRVRCLGLVPESTLIALYRRAFALVFPSFFGPENMPPLEAFALRCPVLAASVAGAQEQLQDAALLFDPRSEHALAAAILQLEREPTATAARVARGHLLAEAYSGDNFVRHVFAIVDEFAAFRRCWSVDEPYVHS